MHSYPRLLIAFALGTAAFTQHAAAQPSCAPGWDTSPDIATFNSVIYSMTVYDDGNGPALYAGGLFTATSDGPAERIAKWDGSVWVDVGGGVSAEPGVASVKAFAAFDDGSGPALFAGGDILTAGGVAAPSVAKWDGHTWSAVGGGLNRRVNALLAYDDGRGLSLFAGTTTLASGELGGVWRYDGTSWSMVGDGMGDFSGLVSVLALEAFDDGAGPALYAGGIFDSADGNPASYIARWDGSAWHPVGGGLDEPVWDLHVFDDGGGPALFAGGTFFHAGGVESPAIAKWDGTQWSSLGNQDFPGIFAITTFDDGSGPALYAAGGTGVGSNPLYRWDGVTWSAVARDITGSAVQSLVSFDRGDGPALYVGGDLHAVGGIDREYFAVWHGCTEAAAEIPTISEWGCVILALVLLAAGTHLTRRRRACVDV